MTPTCGNSTPCVPSHRTRIRRAGCVPSSIQVNFDQRSSSRPSVCCAARSRAGSVARNSISFTIADGSGEGAGRHLLSTYFGSAVGELRMVGTVPGRRRDSLLEVWTATQIRRGRDSGRISAVVWLTPNDLANESDRAELVDATTRAALALVADAGLLPAGAHHRSTPRRDSVDTGEFAEDGRSADDARHLDGERSILEFNARVLAMAEDAGTPLL